MKKLALLVSLMAFIFVASVSTSYAQTTDDKAKTEKTVSTQKDAPPAKAPCSKAKASKCPSAKKSGCCKKSAHKSKKSGATKKEDAVIEEKEKAK